MDVKTGAIRAMVNLLRDPKSHKLSEMQNLAIGRRGEPGSVFKTVTLVSVLSDGYIKSLNERMPTNHGYRADEIIALTFTKKAATEMKERIRDLVGPNLSRKLWMGTFHSLFSRILRQEAERLGFKSDFTIYDQTDARSLVKAIIKEMGLDDKIYKPNGIQAQISNAKNNLITPGMYLANRELMSYDAKAKRPRMGEIYQTYWNRCYQAGAMDFDDLLLYTNILFRDHPDVLNFYQNYFKYVLVDEYQDTNKAQNLIVEQLVRGHKHLTVVGDDAQSIYSFRGANINNILDLNKHIPETKLFKLEQNYRSTKNIVNAANSLISKNKGQIKKTIFSENDEGSLLQCPVFRSQCPVLQCQCPVFR